MTEAEKLFNQVVLRAINLWSIVRIFDKCISLALSGRRAFEALERGLVDANRERFESLLDILAPADRPALTDSLRWDVVTSSMRNTLTAGNAAGIVFAHSIVDSVALDFCKVTALASLEDWASVVGARKVSLDDVHNQGYSDLLRSAVDSHLKQLGQESVVKKVDQLFARCQPPVGFRVVENFDYDPERLGKIDKIRQDIIHGRALLREVNDMTAELDFLERTTIHLQGIVQKKYGLTIDANYWARLMKGDPTA